MSDKPIIHTTQVFRNTRLLYEPPFRVICYACPWTETGKTLTGINLTAHKHEQNKNHDMFDKAGELHDEAHVFLTDAFKEPPLLRHDPQDFMINTLAAWCENQVFMRKARSWQHALAIFIHEANAGLDFNHPISEFTDDPKLLKEWVRGDHL